MSDTQAINPTSDDSDDDDVPETQAVEVEADADHTPEGEPAGDGDDAAGTDAPADIQP